MGPLPQVTTPHASIEEPLIDDVGHILNPTFAPRTCEPSSQTVADSADVSASQTRASYRDILLQRPQPSSPKKKARKAKLAEKAAPERKKLYQLGVNAARIINIHYPDQKIMTVPVHNDYYRELLDTLASIKPILGYDPTKPSTLRDPKFTSLTEEERHKQAVVVHQTRLARIIQNIRSPGLQYSVAKYFYQ
ncbi:hypothetical protein MFLAVUS_007812 [Mucor flavus]|uniref:Uncharacterized protein n=1 Tax=Mucor flavus TaxID=439312 RepID=A0ABP9Z5C3_9FUNG